MEKKELKKANGDVFIEVERQAENSYILVNWVGIQSIETVMMGANLILNMLRKMPCPNILNSNKELVGPWDDGALYLGHHWVLQARVLGVRRFAHVLAPGIYGQRSFENFLQPAKQHLQVKTFNSDAEAEAWLL